MKKFLLTLTSISALGLASAFADPTNNGGGEENGGEMNGGNGGMPVPEAVSTLGILGLGLAGLAVARRRFKK